MTPSATNPTSVSTAALSSVIPQDETGQILEIVDTNNGLEPAVSDPSDEKFSETPKELSAFVDLGLSSQVISAIKKAGYSIPTPIQLNTIPGVLESRDLMGQAETGSGKTAAFAWPILSKIDVKTRSPQVLVLTPTRELAIQVTQAFEKYGSCIDGFRAVPIYGGQSYETQLRALRKGVHVVVGTPGRVMDHLRRETLDLSNLTTFVLDEADEMLRMGFIDDVEWTMEQLPETRQILLFSATLPAPVRNIATRYLNDPLNIAIKPDNSAADSIKQTCVQVHPREKLQVLSQILESEPTDGVIVFVKTRNSTVIVADQLSRLGFSVSPLNGDIPQNQRERTVNQLKSGRLNIIVATDVAARGLDVKRISHVINYDFPHDTEAYVHRIGRTGRAGQIGCAILFFEPKEKGKLARLQRSTSQKIAKFSQKTIKEINEVRVAEFKQRITAGLDHEQTGFFEKLIAETHSETNAPIEKIAASLAVMAQGNVPLLLTESSRTKSNWKKDSEGRGKRYEGEMATYRIEVGRNHGVGPGNIVGAITNEAELNNSHIGKIRLFDRYSTIDLPANIGDNVIEMLQDVVVSGKRLQISRSNSGQFNSRRDKPKKNNGSTNFSGKQRNHSDHTDKNPGVSRDNKKTTPKAVSIDRKPRKKKPAKTTKKYVKIRSAR